MGGVVGGAGMRPAWAALALGWLLPFAWCEPAGADGGTVRLSRVAGRYRVSAFTAPTPFRAGPVDISVLVQDATTGEPIPSARVTLLLTRRGRPGAVIRKAATTAAATNKLFHAAVFDLPAPGRWDVEALVEGEGGGARVRFDLAAAAAAPRWPDLWPWVGWPAPVILLYAIHQALVWRKLRPPRRPSDGRNGTDGDQRRGAPMPSATGGDGPGPPPPGPGSS